MQDDLTNDVSFLLVISNNYQHLSTTFNHCFIPSYYILFTTSLPPQALIVIGCHWPCIHSCMGAVIDGAPATISFVPALLCCHSGLLKPDSFDDRLLRGQVAPHGPKPWPFGAEETCMIMYVLGSCYILPAQKLPAQCTMSQP